MSQKKTATKIQDEITKILWTDWNPIGGEVPEDEYQSYTPRIFQALEENCGAYFLMQILEHISENLIGNRESNYYKSIMVAEKLIITFQKEIIQLNSDKWKARLNKSNKKKNYPNIDKVEIYRGEKKAGEPYKND